VSAAARRAHEGAARKGRPFFVAAVAAALLVVAACGSPRARAHGAAGESLVASGPAGARQIALLACETGAQRAQAALPDALSAPVATDFGRGALYAATTRGELLRFALPDLRLQARVALGFAASALAAAGGPDAIVLAGGRGAQPLSAHDPDTLAPLARYPAGAAGASVSAILDVAARRRLVVAFDDLPELWEIAYAHDAPPVLRGLVHDYRMGEAVPLPGRLTPRPFRVPDGTRALLAGPSEFEVLRIDSAGAAGVVNLDVRREIERPALPAPDPRGITAWRAQQARGWLIRSADGRALVLAPPRWRPEPASGGPDALAAAGERLRQLDALSSGATQPVAVVTGSGGDCEAVLDRDGRWLGRLRAAR